jgi:hypothetical protein
MSFRSCFAAAPSPIGRRRLGPAAAIILSIGAVAAIAEEGAAPVVPPPQPAATPAQIAAWIDQLGSDQFAQREAASRSLSLAGQAAIGPLLEATRREDFEVSTRAFEIIRGFLDAEDADLSAEAEQTVESLAEGPDHAVSSLAIAALDFHYLGMAEAAREKLESLGAIITETLVPSGRRGAQVVLRAGWRGGPDDLRLIARLRGVVLVGLHGVRLDPRSVAVLGRIRGVDTFQLYGTGLSDEALAALAAKLSESKIDVRKGGKLGVGGQPMIGPCLITQVQDGSAAAKAGLQIGDIVLRIDGEPVANFEALTDRVGKHGPGEKIELEIERTAPGAEPERFSRTVPLDGWD